MTFFGAHGPAGTSTTVRFGRVRFANGSTATRWSTRGGGGDGSGLSFLTRSGVKTGGPYCAGGGRATGPDGLSCSTCGSRKGSCSRPTTFATRASRPPNATSPCPTCCGVETGGAWKGSATRARACTGSGGGYSGSS